jgi:cytidylate kinase
MDKFLNYFDSRYRKNLIQGKATDCGPIVTLSRQTGCDAVAVAKRVVSKLNRKYNSNRWHWVDKEVLIAAAKKLETGSHRVESSIQGDEKSGISEMISAISGSFISDSMVKKVIQEIVNSICKDGYVVFVGRGGVSITRAVKKSLHVRLVAPFYWRVENIMKKREIDIETAEEYVVDNDEKRFNTIQNFLEKKPLNLDYLFDATINRSSYSIEQIAQIITTLYEKRIEMVMSNPESKSDLMNSFG